MRGRVPDWLRGEPLTGRQFGHPRLVLAIGPLRGRNYCLLGELLPLSGNEDASVIASQSSRKDC